MRLLNIPAGVSEETAAAILMKGMTVEYPINRCYALKTGEFALLKPGATQHASV